jgi:hypothetical protein
MDGDKKEQRKLMLALKAVFLQNGVRCTSMIMLEKFVKNQGELTL